MICYVKNAKQKWFPFVPQGYEDVHAQVVDGRCKDVIRIVSKIAGVNYIAARRMLEKDSVCILKAKAIDIKKAVNTLEIADVPYEITPEFKYR